MVYHKILNIVSCTIQQDLVIYPFYMYQFASGSSYTPDTISSLSFQDFSSTLWFSFSSPTIPSQFALLFLSLLMFFQGSVFCSFFSPTGFLNVISCSHNFSYICMLLILNCITEPGPSSKFHIFSSFQIETTYASRHLKLKASKSKQIISSPKFILTNHCCIISS